MNNNTNDVELVCLTCNATFTRKAYNIKNAKKHGANLTFCSAKCHGLYKQEVNYKEMCEKVGMDFKAWLIEKYYDEEKSSGKISELLYETPTNSPNVLGWMKKLEIPSRKRSDAVALQWKDNHERRKKQSEFAINHLGAGTESRKTLIKLMQTESYRLKSSELKMGVNNPMYGVTGENHPNYNPNLTDSERKKQRKIEGYHNWRKVVYKRDGYACVYCGDSAGGNLVAHHLNSYHWDKKGRVDIENGVTLCENCHKSFHTAYGYKENTKEQFNEFFLGV